MMTYLFDASAAVELYADWNAKVEKAGVCYVCGYCQESNNRIKGFTGNGIVAEPYASGATLYYSLISRNQVEENGNHRILIGLAPGNEYNSLFYNKGDGNLGFDCEDDTTNHLTAGTYDTWFHNIDRLSSPAGL